ncbi:MAG: 50S ribosomal protein L18 [Paludibacteraceae bacterium]|nr:50S ribosomal protein L18 [Paludibacteraceae bacterium]
MALTREQRRQRLKKRIRKNVFGNGEKPRLSVFRSNKHISAQIIDDVKGITLVSASSTSKNVDIKGTKTEVAQLVGKIIAEKAVASGIKNVVFDRNGYLFHGRVKALAQSAKDNGLTL